ncbi:MAG: hypothetical protein KIS73_05445 [Enhydrobacter sp.]|nr:hypothetical protein [Enhydrobacter sp.]
MTVRYRLVPGAMLALLVPSLAFAQVWPSEMRRTFIDECLASCGANTRFTSVQRAECPPYCECMIREAQSFMSADDYTDLQRAYAEKTSSPMRERYESLSAVCSRRVFR